MEEFKAFIVVLDEYLESECYDYDIRYKFDKVDFNKSDVIVSRFGKEVTLHFKYDYDEKNLYIKTREDYYKKTSNLDSSVKYFWIMIAELMVSLKGENE